MEQQKQQEQEQQQQEEEEEKEEEKNQCVLCENDAYFIDIFKNKIFCSERCQIAYYKIENIQIVK
jgi:hypothetical protein